MYDLIRIKYIELKYIELKKIENIARQKIKCNLGKKIAFLRDFVRKLTRHIYYRVAP